MGSYNPFNVKTEMYLTKVGRWHELKDYPFVKGVVDKNFEAVESFHGHIRTQQGQLP